MPQTDDQTILEHLRRPATRERGYRVLMETYQERLYWQVRRIVHVHADADDALQNTFIRAFKSIDKFRGEASLYTWLYRIATNEALQIRRKQSRQPATVDLNDADEQSNLMNRLRADPHFDGTAAQALLYAAIDQLPERQAEVFRLRYFDEMPYREMGELLDLSTGALKASYHHAVTKIKSYVRQYQA